MRVERALALTQGEHLLHVLNTLESRAVVLEKELKEIDEVRRSGCWNQIVPP